MSQPIVIVGAGGFGREVLMLLRDIERATPGMWEFLGFLDDGSPDLDLLARIDAPFLGNRANAVAGLPEGCYFAVAFGDGKARKAVTDELLAEGLLPAVLVHPSAIVGDDVHFGPGSVVCAGSLVTTNVQLGAGAQVNLACTIGHDVRAGEYVTLSPAVSLSGAVHLGDLSTVYTRAAVNPGIAVGDGAVVGAGAVVAKDVAPGSVVVGIPAKPLGR